MFMVVAIVCAQVVVCSDIDLKDKAVAMAESAQELLHNGLVAQKERQSTQGLIPGLFFVAQDKFVAATKIVQDGLSTAASTVSDMMNSAGRNAQQLIEEALGNRMSKKDVLTSSEVGNDNVRIDACSNNQDAVHPVQKPVSSMYECICQNPGRTLSVTGAVATIIGVTYYVYMHSGDQQE
jgi:hypothetical protein